MISCGTGWSDPADELAAAHSRHQLQVSEPEFWSCVRDGVKPDRGMPEPPAEALPADLAYLLINRVGLSESEVAAMSKANAVDRLNRYWTEGT